MRKATFTILAVLFLAASAAAIDPLDPSFKPAQDCLAADYPNNIWITDGMNKVHQDSGGYVAGPCASMYAAQNEFESFQIHEHAGASPITLNNVTVSDLVNAQTGTHIVTTTNILVYREAYINITTKSNTYSTTGQTPDILIPTKDPYYNQARTAFPVTIAANQNQSVWIDIQVPANAPSGYYAGTATVTNGGSTYAVLPILLAVWNFSLPSTPSLKSAFSGSATGMCDQAYGGYSACGSFPGASGSDNALELIHVDQAKLALDHRISDSAVVEVAPTSSDFTHLNSLISPLMNGTASTLLSGAKLTEIGYYPGARLVSPSTPLQWWATDFSSNGWTSKLVFGLCDEPPNGCLWTDIPTRAVPIHGVTPPLPGIVTTSIAKATANSVLSSIDILSVVITDMDWGVNHRPDYNTWIAGGGTLWWYLDCVSNGAVGCTKNVVGGTDATFANYSIDVTPVKNRVFQWQAYLYKITAELYFATDYCWEHFTDHCTAAGDAVTLADPWTQVYAFGGNGDGTLYYPGTPAKIGGTTPVTIPSMRLKLIRDGMEDYEYLNILSNLGQGTFATTTANSFITNLFTFNETSSVLQSARLTLGNKIHALSLGGTGGSPLGRLP